MTEPLPKRAELLLSAAEAAIDAGMSIVATEPHAKNPDIRFCPHGLNSATSSLKKVKRWLRQDPEINLAASLKGSGICGVDVDGERGEEALRHLSNLPRTRKTKTRNGTHRFYRYDGDLGGSVIKFAPDLDFIMSGYVMLPGSRHPDGGRYKSQDVTFPIAKMPSKLFKALRDHRKDRSKAKTHQPRQALLTKGGRNNSLASIAGALRRQGYEEEVLFTVLDSFNQNFCKPPLMESEIDRIASGMMRYAPEHEELFQLMADVTPRDVEFLWKPYFVRGAVNLLEGDSNVGKTYFFCWIGAAASSGGKLPDGSRIELQKVLFLSAEDDPETTLVKRMMRMGADRNRIWVMKKFLRLNEDALQLIEKHVVEHGVTVILMDPLLAYMESGIDMNKANETRPFMARLAELAKEHNLTIIALRHLNKSTDKKAIHRGLGSVDITAASRSAVMIGLHPDDEEVRVFAHSKHNLSARGDSLLYTLEGETEHKVPKLIWNGITELTAEDLTPKPNKVGRPDNASQDAEQFLRRALAGGGAKPAKDIIREGERRSIIGSTLRKVARKIGVIKKGRTWKLAETPT